MLTVEQRQHAERIIGDFHAQGFVLLWFQREEQLRVYTHREAKIPAALLTELVESLEEVAERLQEIGQ